MPVEFQILTQKDVCFHVCQCLLSVELLQELIGLFHAKNMHLFLGYSTVGCENAIIIGCIFLDNSNSKSEEGGHIAVDMSGVTSE